MGKSTISVVMVNSYVKLPEGMSIWKIHHLDPAGDFFPWKYKFTKAFPASRVELRERIHLSRASQASPSPLARLGQRQSRQERLQWEPGGPISGLKWLQLGNLGSPWLIFQPDLGCLRRLMKKLETTSWQFGSGHFGFVPTNSFWDPTWSEMLLEMLWLWCPKTCLEIHWDPLKMLTSSTTLAVLFVGKSPSVAKMQVSAIFGVLNTCWLPPSPQCEPRLVVDLFTIFHFRVPIR